MSPWSQDGNQRMFLLRDRPGGRDCDDSDAVASHANFFCYWRIASSTSDPCELRVNLYRDNFEVSTQDAWEPLRHSVMVFGNDLCDANLSQQKNHPKLFQSASRK